MEVCLARLASFGQLHTYVGLTSGPLMVSKFHNVIQDPKGLKKYNLLYSDKWGPSLQWVSDLHPYLLWLAFVRCYDQH